MMCLRLARLGVGVSQTVRPNLASSPDCSIIIVLERAPAGVAPDQVTETRMVAPLTS